MDTNINEEPVSHSHEHIVDKVISNSSVSEEYCKNCIYFNNVDKIREGSQARMIENNICHKRGGGACPNTSN